MTSVGWSNPVLKVRALNEVNERRKRPSTYTDPLTKSPDMKEFLQEFYKNIYKQERKEWYRAERAKYPTLEKNYEDLCGKTVSYEDFWMRYERRCNLDRVMKELADRDAARVEQTKTVVSDIFHKAWSAVPATTAGLEATALSEVSDNKEADDENKHQATPKKEIEFGKKVSSPMCMRESTPSSVTLSPPMSQEKPKDDTAESIRTKWQLEVPSIASLKVDRFHGSQGAGEQDSISAELKKSPLGNRKTSKKLSDKHEVPPVLTTTATEIVPIVKLARVYRDQKTDKQDCIFDELRKSLPGNKETSKKPHDKQEVPPESTPTLKEIVPIAAGCAISRTKEPDLAPYDNQMADTAALLLLLVFLIVTNLPL
jgi:hypothetical protein